MFELRANGVNPKTEGGKIAQRLVYICSPYRASPTRTVAQNVDLAQRLCHAALDDGFVPFAPHLFFTRFLDEENEKERASGIAAALRFLGVMDQVWVFDHCGISEGMRLEIAKAADFGLPVFYRPAAWRNIWPNG